MGKLNELYFFLQMIEEQYLTEEDALREIEKAETSKLISV